MSENRFLEAITKRIAQKLDDAQHPPAQRPSARMMIATTGGLATDQRPLAPAGQPVSPYDHELARLGFEAGQRYALRDVDARLTTRWPDDVEQRLGAKGRLQELGMISDGWADPRAQQPGGPPATGIDRLQAGAAPRRGTLVTDRRTGKPAVLRSHPG